jgi:hypothetical protein
MRNRLAISIYLETWGGVLHFVHGRILNESRVTKTDDDSNDIVH